MNILRKNFFIWLGCILLASISFVIIFKYNTKTEYNLLYILPLVYIMCLFLFPNIYTKDNTNQFIYLLLQGEIILRYILAPIIFIFCDYFTIYSLSTYAIRKSIFVMAYEIIMIHILLTIILNKYNNKNLSTIKCINTSYENSSKLKIVLFLLIIMILVMIAINPGCTKLYRSGLDFFNYEFTGFDSNKDAELYMSNFIMKLCYVTFRYLFKIFRIIFPCIIAKIMYDKKYSKKITIFITLILMCILNILIMDDTIANSICFMLVGLIYLSMLYKDNKIYVKSLVTCVVLVCIYFLSRFILGISFGVKTSSLRFLSNALQSYFSGFTNIAACFNMPIYEFSVRFKYFYYEILKGIPYATTILGLDGTNISNVYHEANNIVGQIQPTLGTSAYYFGIFLSPIISLILIYIGMKSSFFSMKKKNILKKIALITISLYCILGISMYSIEIASAGIFSVGVPIYLLGIICEENVDQNEKL